MNYNLQLSTTTTAGYPIIDWQEECQSCDDQQHASNSPISNECYLCATFAPKHQEISLHWLDWTTVFFSTIFCVWLIIRLITITKK